MDWGDNTASAVPTQESSISASADGQGNFMSSIMIAVTVITVTAFLLWYFTFLTSGADRREGAERSRSSMHFALCPSQTGSHYANRRMLSYSIQLLRIEISIRNSSKAIVQAVQ
eukprot:3742334-Amphidinium_carterae.1